MVTEVMECTCNENELCECIETGDCNCACGCVECVNTYVGYADADELHSCGCGGTCNCAGAMDEFDSANPTQYAHHHD